MNLVNSSLKLSVDSKIIKNRNYNNVMKRGFTDPIKRHLTAIPSA
jgi:hypothetical protein